VTATLIAPERAALIPDVGKPRPVKLPTVADETLKNGLRVLVARRPGVPRVEVRVVIPTARGEAGPSAALRMVTRTLLSGTTNRSALDIAALLQQIGGSLDANADEEDVVLTGSALAPDLSVLLDLIAELVTDSSHPADEVVVERERLVQEITLARSQPETIAREALMRRLFGKHPYERGLPEPREVARVKADDLAGTRRQWLLPKGSVLVVVGDVRPDRAVKAAEAAFSGWKSPRGTAAAGLPEPAPIKPGPVVLVDRPGSVQTSIRMAGDAIDRKHAQYPALALANLIVGGYFISRLSDNIREKRGFTYGVGSGVQHLRRRSMFTLQTDVGTENTGPALVEIRYELERMLVGPITPAELQSAKRYLGGTLAMSIQTQAGLASYLGTLAVNDLPIEYLRDFPKQVEALDEPAVIEAARAYMTPSRLVTVLVGDRSAVEAPAASLGGSVQVVKAK
jgi:predicted Zn-dependent peptidase